MQFAGTITLRFDALIQVLRDIYESLIKHGFKKFMFINAHGGNNAVIELLAYETKKIFCSYFCSRFMEAFKGNCKRHTRARREKSHTWRAMEERS
jgi:creatinine amidohydrolase